MPGAARTLLSGWLRDSQSLNRPSFSRKAAAGRTASATSR